MEDLRMMVAQDNRLIQKISTDNNKKRNLKMSSFVLSPYQKKFIALMMSHLKPNDTEFPLEEISINDFVYLMNIRRGGNTYQKIHQAIQELMSISFAIEEEPNRWKYLRWIASGCVVDENTNIVTIKFDDCLKPYLLEMDKSFTVYELGYISNLKKKYSLRLYEFLRSYAAQGKIKISVENFINKIVDGQYNIITDIERYVIKPAIEEINQTTDIHVTYGKIHEKKNRRSKTKEFFFRINFKSEEELKEVIATWGIIPCDELIDLDLDKRQYFRSNVEPQAPSTTEEFCDDTIEEDDFDDDDDEDGDFPFSFS